MNSNANFKFKINKLGFHSNYLLEKYSILQKYSLEKLPGLKPNSSWPVNLNDLISELFKLDLFQMFHSPFDLNSDFYLEALEFIEKYYFYYLESLIKMKSESLSEADKKMLECESLLYEEYLIKAIATVFAIKLMQGNFTHIFNFLKSLKNIFKNVQKQKQKSNKFDCLNLQQLNNQLLIRSLNDKMDQSNKNLNLAKYCIKNVIDFVKENKILPIMRNYSIYEIATIHKNILFTPVRHVFSNCSSVTTDSSYLYIILSGVNGGMIKLGTGYNNTIKGKVYLHVNFTDANLHALNNPNLTNNNNNNKQNASTNQTANVAAASINNNSNQIANQALQQQQQQPIANEQTNAINNPNQIQNQNASTIPNQNQNQFILNDDASYQWVYLKGKLYLKQNSSTSFSSSNSAFAAFPGAQAPNTNNNRELGFITIVDPESFKIEGRIKMVFPEDAKHPAIKRKNENFVLLSNGENLNVLLLEPVFKNAKQMKNSVNLKQQENSDSDENENFVAETVVKEQNILGKKSKYASYAASAAGNGFRGESLLPNFQEDLFSYVNLLLLTFKVDNIEENIIKPEVNDCVSKRNVINKKLEEAEKNFAAAANNKNKKSPNSNTDINNNNNNINNKQDQLVNEGQIILITEIYDCFAHIYTIEECRKALILNNWNPEKTALFLTDSEKEIKQPLLLVEKSTLLFQTKIEAISTKNNRVEFKTVKNPIFDVTQFDLLKWTATKERVLGYKIKEGACVLFDVSAAAQRDFPYTYTEKVRVAALSPSVAGTQPQARSGLNVKGNKTKFNVNWKESVSDINSGSNASSSNNNNNNLNFNSEAGAISNNNFGNKFYLNDEISIEKRILETIKLESLIGCKALGLSGAEPNASNSNNNNKYNNFNSNLASPGNLNENGSSLLNNYLNEALNMEEIANLSNLGFEKSPSKFINAYLAKNEIKKVIKPQILRGTSSSTFSTSNINNNINKNNNNLSVNFSSSVACNPLHSNNSFENVNNIKNANNYSNTVNVTNTIGIPAFDNFVSIKDEKEKLLQNDNSASAASSGENKKSKNANANIPNEFLDNNNKKKKSKKKVKDSLDNHKEEIASKVFIKRVATENINNNHPLNYAAANINNTKADLFEEVILNDTVKGTFIKVVPCLQLLKMDAIFCFDHKNKIYYLLGNNSISLNLMISNTFAIDAEMIEIFLNAKAPKNKNKNGEEEDNKKYENEIVSELEEFMAKEDFDYESKLDYFEALSDFVKKLSLVVNNNKQEMPWKYANWNYFYLNVYELLNMVNFFYKLIFIFNQY